MSPRNNPSGEPWFRDGADAAPPQPAAPKPPVPSVEPVETTETLPSWLIQKLKRDQNGLFAAIAQQYDSKEVLMLAWMNDEALRRTLASGLATYWSRSRSEYWCKGDTSGHYQHIKSVSLDCDGDAVLLQVDQTGAACHTGKHTCFHTSIPGGGRLG